MIRLLVLKHESQEYATIAGKPVLNLCYPS